MHADIGAIIGWAKAFHADISDRLAALENTAKSGTAAELEGLKDGLKSLHERFEKANLTQNVSGDVGNAVKVLHTAVAEIKGHLGIN